MFKRVCFHFWDPLTCFFRREPCAAVCFGSGLSAQSWKRVSCYLVRLQIGREMETRWPLAIVFNCLKLESKGQLWACDCRSNETSLPLWIPVDIFKPEGNGGVDSQQQRQQRLSPCQYTFCSLWYLFPLLFLHFPFPIAMKCHTVKLKRYTIRERDCEEWGGGEWRGASQWKDECYGDSCFSAAFSLRRKLVISAPCGSYSKNQLCKCIEQRDYSILTNALGDLAKNDIKAHLQ